MEVYDALKTAMQSLRAQQKMYGEEFKLTASRAGQDWVFWFVFLPATPGKDVTAVVDPNGDVRILVGF